MCPPMCDSGGATRTVADGDKLLRNTPLSSWTDTCTSKEKANTSVKSSKSNYTSVRKDVIHINHYKTNENGTITVVIYIVLIKNRERYNQCSDAESFSRGSNQQVS